MTEIENQNQNTVWTTVGVVTLAQSGKSINLLLNGKNYVVSVKGIEGVISGKYPTSNISLPTKV